MIGKHIYRILPHKIMSLLDIKFTISNNTASVKGPQFIVTTEDNRTDLTKNQFPGYQELDKKHILQRNRLLKQ